MKTVYLNSKKIKKAIRRGSNSTGSHVLAINPAGNCRVVWLYNKRTFSPFRDDEVIINIPEVDEVYWNKMVDAFDWWYWGIDRTEVDRLLYQQTLLEWLTDCFPSYIRDCKDQAADWLYAAFHLALRGDGRFLNLTDPWNGQLVGRKKPQDYFEFIT